MLVSSAVSPSSLFQHDVGPTSGAQGKAQGLIDKSRIAGTLVVPDQPLNRSNGGMARGVVSR